MNHEVSNNNNNNDSWLRDDCRALFGILHRATRVTKRARLMRLGLNQAYGVVKRFPRAQFLEFGCHEGKDIVRLSEFLAALERQTTGGRRQEENQNDVDDPDNNCSGIVIHGFDSFEGLPEDWDNGQTTANGKLLHSVGAFSVNGQVPVLEKVQNQLVLKQTPADKNNNTDNMTRSSSQRRQLQGKIQFHKGWFHETLPPFLDGQMGNTDDDNKHIANPSSSSSSIPPIAFIHADADLYSSTLTFLQLICDRRLLCQGSIIVFDEYWNYPNWQAGEFRAWMEITRQYDIEFDYLAYHAPSPNQTKNTYGYQSVVVMVTRDMKQKK